MIQFFSIPFFVGYSMTTRVFVSSLFLTIHFIVDLYIHRFMWFWVTFVLSSSSFVLWFSNIFPVKSCHFVYMWPTQLNNGFDCILLYTTFLVRIQLLFLYLPHPMLDSKIRALPLMVCVLVVCKIPPALCENGLTKWNFYNIHFWKIN